MIKSLKGVKEEEMEVVGLHRLTGQWICIPFLECQENGPPTKSTEKLAGINMTLDPLKKTQLGSTSTIVLLASYIKP